MPGNTEKTGHEKTVWDRPVRLFHWIFAGLVVFSFWAGKEGHMDWHIRSGFAVLTLLFFRIIWGFAGSETARFSTFLKSPRAVAQNICNLAPARYTGRKTGHNALGGYATVAILLIVGVQAGLGLFADDEILTRGPLSHLVSPETAHMLTEWHENWAWAVVAIAVIHVGAILYYWLVLKTDLVAPMVTGRAVTDDPAPRMAPAYLALAALALAVFAVWYIFEKV